MTKPKPQIDADSIRAETEKLLKINSDEAFEDDDFQNLFKIQTANRWLKDASTRPIPKMLFGEFWFENELCILFADTNVGKSILAVQIGDAISRGENIAHLKIETEKQKVIYLDFELTDKQFETRYSEKSDTSDFFTNHYEFDENFIRAEINPDADLEQGFASFEDYLNNSLNYTIAQTGAKVLIVDNITYLKTDNERAKDALPLMKHLKRLKTRFNLSILVLAHTPKRDLSKELTINDLSGSKMLMNFIDSSFAIGRSAKDESLRYLKQIKERSVVKKYGSDNVILSQLEKPSNFLNFDFIGFGRESEHLKNFSERDRKELIEQVKNLSALGESQRAIARELSLSIGAVNKYLNM